MEYLAMLSQSLAIRKEYGIEFQSSPTSSTDQEQTGWEQNLHFIGGNDGTIRVDCRTLVQQLPRDRFRVYDDHIDPKDARVNDFACKKGQKLV
jgi:hypothetical protein